MAASPPILTGVWTLQLRRSEKLGPVLALLGLRGFGTYMAEMMGETLTIVHDAETLACKAASMFSSSEDTLRWGEAGEISFGGERMTAIARWLDAGAVGDARGPASGITTDAPCVELEVTVSKNRGKMLIRHFLEEDGAVLKRQILMRHTNGKRASSMRVYSKT